MGNTREAQNIGHSKEDIRHLMHVWHNIFICACKEKPIKFS